MDKNGKILWKKAMGRVWDQSYPDSRSMPTVNGNKVYNFSGYGDLACFNGNTGEIIWSYKASEENRSTYGNWSIAESLIIDGDKLYFSPGGTETMTIALNKNTGKLIWKSESLGITSHCMGGYGALKIAMHHPDIFNTVYAISPRALTIVAEYGPNSNTFR